MIWYDADIRKLGDGDGMVTGGGTEVKVSIPSHPIPIPFRWEYHPNTLPRKALISGVLTHGLLATASITQIMPSLIYQITQLCTDSVTQPPRVNRPRTSSPSGTLSNGCCLFR